MTGPISPAIIRLFYHTKAMTVPKYRSPLKQGHADIFENRWAIAPILRSYLNFSRKETPAKSLFAGQDKLKLVMPCQGDQYVVREWMIYKVYNLVSDKSYKARLVRVELDDSQRKKKKSSPFYGILLEEDDQMAKRNKMVRVKRKMLRMNQTEQSTFLKMAVFEYLIGNTDWSVEYQQNVELIAKDSVSMPLYRSLRF